MHSVIMVATMEEYPGCAKNREHKFKRAVQSFLDNLWKEKELIIISDGCRKIENVYYQLYKNESQIRFLLADKQPLKYPGKLRGIGCEMAAGETVSYLDSDDYIDSYFIVKVHQGITLYNLDLLYYDLLVADQHLEYPNLEDFKRGDIIDELKGYKWTAVPSKLERRMIGTGNISHAARKSYASYWHNWDGEAGSSEDWRFIESVIKDPAGCCHSRSKFPTGYYSCHYSPANVDL